MSSEFRPTLYICNLVVTGVQGMSDPHHGPAHITCYQVSQTRQRKFEGLNISALADANLTDLQDLVLAEVNERMGGHDDEIELF